VDFTLLLMARLHSLGIEAPGLSFDRLQAAQRIHSSGAQEANTMLRVLCKIAPHAPQLLPLYAAQGGWTEILRQVCFMLGDPFRGEQPRHWRPKPAATH